MRRKDESKESVSSPQFMVTVCIMFLLPGDPLAFTWQKEKLHRTATNCNPAWPCTDAYKCSGMECLQWMGIISGGAPAEQVTTDSFLHISKFHSYTVMNRAFALSIWFSLHKSLTKQSKRRQMNVMAQLGEISEHVFRRPEFQVWSYSSLNRNTNIFPV